MASNRTPSLVNGAVLSEITDRETEIRKKDHELTLEQLNCKFL